jgi:hypothetical protein
VIGSKLAPVSKRIGLKQAFLPTADPQPQAVPAHRVHMLATSNDAHGSGTVHAYFHVLLTARQT